jgi:lambda family phage portal protein
MDDAMDFGDGVTSARVRVRVKAMGPTPQRANYDAGRQRRRLAGWTPSSVSINALLAADGALMRNRARDLVRNNPYASSACESFVANIIGTGIKPSWLIEKDPERKDKVQKLWRRWTDEADADALTDFNGLQSLVATALFEGGECFVRFRSRKASDGLSVPLQVQLMESELLPFEDNRVAENGNVVINGVEFDQIGRRVAYHFLSQHPGDMVYFTNRAKPYVVRVPASEVMHIFRPKRPGQVRGVPWISPSIVKLWLLDQYDDAELDRKKTAAMYAGFIRSAVPEEVAGQVQAGGAVNDDGTGLGSADKEGIVTLEPGTMQALLPGEELQFSAPVDVGGSYEMFEYRNILAAFAGIGVPYAFGTGDLKKVNYSSLRGAIIEYRRRLEQIQHGVMVHQFCRRVALRWLSDAVLAGALDLPGFARDPQPYTSIKWITPKFDWVDPLKDQQAEAIAVDNGFKARSDVIEEMGYDPEETDRRIAADRAREADMKLTFKGSQAVQIPQDAPVIDDSEDPPTTAAA